ncbi:MAG: ATP-binding protein, partial [Bacteroidales bacterium]|nr:ATP-binding protein [Bacteroidales bacterium]
MAEETVPKMEYGDAQIVTMEGVEHIRRRPGMYIGRLGDGRNPGDGIYVLLKEIIDNSIDEYAMGFGKQIQVTIADEQVRVRDFGRGIPLDSVVKAVSILNTGGKFDDKAFKKSVGLNGVGTKAVNALSERFYVCSHRGGECSWASFERGELKDSGKGPTKEKDGTLVRFFPDRMMFGDFHYNMDYVETMVKNYSYLKKGLTLVLNDTPYMSQNGLLDLVNDNLTEDPLYPPIHLEGEDIEIVLSHGNSYGENISSFVNGQNTRDGGTHLAAYREAIAKTLKDFFKKNYEPADCRQGIVGAI